MAESRTMRVEGDEWSRLQERAKAGADDGVAGILAEHRDAPVRALLVTTAGDRGARTRLTMVGGQVVLVTQRLARVDGESRVEPGALITFSGPDGWWDAVARALPDTELLRSPGTGEAADAGTELPAGDADAVLAAEECNLQVRVEAWRGGDAPAVLWHRLWSVSGGRLIDVRVEDGAPRLVVRPAGSVARELQWALVGAVDATTGTQEGAR